VADDKAKSNGRGPVVVARGPEFTNVNDETERKIPLRTWITCSLVTSYDVAAFVGILVLFSRQLWNWSNPPRIYGHSWGAVTLRTLAIWWPSAGMAMLTASIAWSMVLLRRLWMETAVKQFPQYTPYPSEYGKWRPNRRMPIPGVDEYEMDAQESKPETINLNLWDILKGKGKRKRMRAAPELRVDERARAFYRAVAGKAASFSEAGAKKHRISPVQFRENIRDPLMLKGLATWKDDKHHEQGIVLTDGALATLEHLGRNPLPRERA